MMKNCAKNVILLSDYHDRTLNVIKTAQVRMHLMLCLSCRVIFQDLEQIVVAAAELRDRFHFKCPDQKVSWRRIRPTIFRSSSHERPSA